MDNIEILLRAKTASENLSYDIKRNLLPEDYLNQKRCEALELKTKAENKLNEFIKYHDDKTKGMSNFEIMLYNDENHVRDEYNSLKSELAYASNVLNDIESSIKDFTRESNINKNKVKSLCTKLDKLSKDIETIDELIRDLNIGYVY